MDDNYASDVHTIAVIKAPEEYENIKEEFRDVIAMVNYYIMNPNITICENNYEIKFALCTDYKVGNITQIHNN